jgi:3-phosphoshikimate 1-carboxyvinyltransferase
MIARVFPGALAGRVPAIVSKSAAHRALMLAALSGAPTLISPEAHSEDIDATLRCLAALGASCENRADGFLVKPGTRAPGGEADCGESGSTLRFLIPLVAALGNPTRFLGRGRLPQRPLGPLTDALMEHGCAFDAPSLPFTISGKLSGGDFLLPGDVSSQFVTGLLMALPLVGGGRVHLTTPLESAGYVRMTVSAMALFGVPVREIEGGWTVPGEAYRSPGALTVEGDWSNAAFFLAAGAEVDGLDETSAQPDRAIADMLKAFHAPIRTLDVRETPDLLPILAAVAAWTPGETRFTGAARLRIKESDRLRSMAEGLRAVGGVAIEEPDGLTVRCEQPPAGGEVDAAGDHRIAMAFAILGTRCLAPVTIRGAEAVNKSYPAFFEDFRRLGGSVDVFQLRDDC